MNPTLKIFKKEITIQLEGNTEHDIKYAFRHIEEFITSRFYNCDAKIVEGKLMVEDEIDQIRNQIDYCESKLRELRRDKGQYLSLAFQRSIDEGITKAEDEIHGLKNLLSIKEA